MLKYEAVKMIATEILRKLYRGNIWEIYRHKLDMMTCIYNTVLKKQPVDLIKV